LGDGPHPNLPPTEEGTASSQSLLNQDSNNISKSSKSEAGALLSSVGGVGGGREAGADGGLSPLGELEGAIPPLGEG